MKNFNFKKAVPQQQQPLNVVVVPKEKKEFDREKTIQKVDGSISMLEEYNMDITIMYDNWIKLGFALGSLGEDGRAFYHRLSKRFPKYTFEETDKKFTEILKKIQTEGAKMTVGSFFYLLDKVWEERKALERKEKTPYFMRAGYVDQYRKDENVVKVNEEKKTPLLTESTKNTLVEVEKETEIINLSPEYKLSFNHKCKNTSSLLKLNGINILGEGNICTIIGHPGTGKSQGCEPIIANFLNSSCDSLGFKTLIPNNKKVLYVDTERTHDDCFKSYKRIASRVDIENNKNLLTDENTLKGFDFISFIEVDSIAERIKILEEYISTNQYALVIIDGITDFVNSVNSEEESKGIILKIIALANKHKIGVVLTIHDNPTASEQKARGHIGSEVLRKSESVLLLKKEDDNVRCITTDFKYGKNRNDSDLISSYFSWNNDKQMFTSIEYEPKIKKQKSGKISMQEIIEKNMTELFSDTSNTTLSFSELFSKYAKAFDCGESTAKNHIKEALEIAILIKDKESGLYSFKKQLNSFEAAA